VVGRGSQAAAGVGTRAWIASGVVDERATCRRMKTGCGTKRSEASGGRRTMGGMTNEKK